jgi:Tfp pilus assembly protein PilX
MDLQSDKWDVLTVMIKGIFNNLRREDGWVVVTAVIVTGLMMGIGLATYATVGTQQTQSRVEGERDSSFNLGESALYAEAFILGKDWPTASNPYPNRQCTEEVTVVTRGCPTLSDIQDALDSPGIPDLASGARWTIRVRDNGSPSTGNDYDSSTDSQPNYDANNDGKLWVRADAVAKGRTRSIVALLQLERLSESVAQNVITAGHFYTSNAGNKVVVDTQGSSATGSQVVVRCTPDLGEPAAGSACIGYDRPKGQVSPDRVYSEPTTPNAMTPEQVDRFKANAIKERTYYKDECPESLTGRYVFVETDSTITCDNYKGDYNTAALPGSVIFTDGILELGMNKTTYYGFVYMLNPPDGTNTMTRLIMHANGTLQGAVSVDGNGGVEAGSDKFNIIFDGAVFPLLETYGTAGLVQNSWRELAPGG